jgi:hypothetical protein
MVRRRATHIFPKDPHGHYVEPAWCSKRLFEEEYFGASGSLVLDPACGWGRCLQAARAHHHRVLGMDIVKRREFGAYPFIGHNFLNGPVPTKAKITSIVCNPPFDHVEEFCTRALATVQFKVAMLCLLRRLPAAHWLGELPLEKIYFLTPRPSMPPGTWITAGNPPGGGTQDFCWLVFTKRTHPKSPVLQWLHRDGGRR